MSIINYNITATNDDGVEVVGSNTWNNNVFLFGRTDINGPWQSIHAGVRFQSIELEPNAEISYAYLNLYSLTGPVGNPSIIWYGNLINNALTWSNTSLPSTINKTSSLTTWRPSGFGSFSINITNIIQEIVNQKNWKYNNHIKLAGINQLSNNVNNYYPGVGFEIGSNITNLTINYIKYSIKITSPRNRRGNQFTLCSDSDSNDIHNIHGTQWHFQNIYNINYYFNTNNIDSPNVLYYNNTIINIWFPPYEIWKVRVKYLKNNLWSTWSNFVQFTTRGYLNSWETYHVLNSNS